MFEDLRLLSLGAAVVLDTVLLMAMMRRPNRWLVPVWMVLLTGGAWLWHSAAFAHTLLEGATGPGARPAHFAAMLTMTCGLLLMPSAMLHGVTRLWRSGLQISPPPDFRYGFFYLPLAALAPAMGLLRADPGGAFLELLAPLVWPYAVWASAVNLASAAGLWQLRRRIELPRVTQFCARMAVILVALSAALLLLAAASGGWSARTLEVVELLITLAPAGPVLLFAYFVIRFQFLPLVLERTLVYGAVVTGILLLHRIVTRNLAARIQEQYHFDLAIVEGALAIGLVLAYAPLRERMAEALRYLFGRRVDRLRDQTRRLAVQMSELAGQPPEDLLAWAVASLHDTLHVEYAAGWLFNADGQATLRRGAAARLSDQDARTLRTGLCDAGLRFCTRSTAVEPALASIMLRGEASIAVVIGQNPMAGLLLLGRQRLGQQPGNEEINALVLLAEQLAGTMNNSVLQAERMLAERRALQNEKLSTLGLLAGSIAHEVKNPLSSIKTIASVLAEQVPAEHREDLQLILSEVDRLSITTSQLLDFARPAVDGGHGQLVPVLERTLRIMRHVARQHDVTIDFQLPGQPAQVRADDSSLREIFFNLLSNSIDAAGPGGRVVIDCRREESFVVTEFHDTGPGIPPELQDRLFQPFFTTKPQGTGLGLYVVARRVRELGGEIRCQSGNAQGTSFIVKLPAAADAGGS